ncbi:hypothetical protein, partial [Streptomyces sp. NPDC001774]
YSKVRVWNGGTVSQETDLDGLTGPDNLPQNITSLKTYGVSGDTAKPRGNGLDQAPIDVVITSSNTAAPILDPAKSEAYKYLYYRNAEGRLITGLVQPAQRGQYTSVTPYEGVYHNTGAGAAEARFRTYITTDNTDGPQTVKAYIDNGKEYAALGLKVDASDTFPTVQRVGRGAVAAGNCAGCTVASPTASQPALFAAQNGRIGLQFATSAVSATLPQIAPHIDDVKLPDGGKVARLGLNVNNTIATLNGTFNPGAEWADETFTTTIITRGDAVNSHPVPAN